MLKVINFIKDKFKLIKLKIKYSNKEYRNVITLNNLLQKGCYDDLKGILKVHPDLVNERFLYGNDFLMLCIHSGLKTKEKLSFLKYLFENYDIDLSRQNSTNQNALMIIDLDLDMDLFCFIGEKFLELAPDKINLIDSWGLPFFYRIINDDNTKGLEYFIDKNPQIIDINTKLYKGWNLTMYCALKGYLNCLKTLLYFYEDQADLGLRDNDGLTALMLAEWSELCWSKNQNTVSLLKALEDRQKLKKEILNKKDGLEKGKSKRL